MQKIDSVELATNVARLRRKCSFFLGMEVRQPLLSARNAFDVVWFVASHARFAVKQNNASVVY